MKNKILKGDALEKLKELPSCGFNMCMTSPPYWALRDYGVEGQLGLEPTFDKYVSNLCDVFDEVKRVLRDDGTCWVNLGDTYYGGGGSAGHTKETKNLGYKTKEMGAVAHNWKRPSREAFKESGLGKNCLECNKIIKTGTNGQFCSRECLNKQGNDFRSQKRLLPDKCLTMIPFRFAIEMVNRGWILRNTIIWHKPNCMPSSVKDRFTVDFEYIFFFSKKKKYYFEQQLEPVKEVSVKRMDYKWEGHREKMSSWEGMNIKKMVSKVNGKYKRNKRTVWKINPKGFKEAHFAVYPEELCETPIKAGCPKEGIVLDPFFGAGTTGLVALKQNKNFLGIELNKEYIEIANKRLKPYLEQTTLK